MLDSAEKDLPDRAVEEFGFANCGANLTTQWVGAWRPLDQSMRRGCLDLGELIHQSDASLKLSSSRCILLGLVDNDSLVSQHFYDLSATPLGW